VYWWSVGSPRKEMHPKTSCVRFISMAEAGVEVSFAHFWLHIHDERIASYGDFIQGVIVPKLTTPFLAVLRIGSRSIRLLSSEFINGRLIMAVQVESEGMQVLHDKRQVTHVMIDPEHRSVVIQESEGGPSSSDVARLIEFAAKLFEPGTQTEVFMPPMLRREELAELFRFQAMEYIASASMEIIRPNHGWTDYYNALTSLADESNASAVMVEMAAPKPSGLRQDRGIVGLLQRLIEATPGLLERFNIRTILSGQQDLTILDLQDYRVRTQEIIPQAPNGSIDIEQLKRSLAEMEPEGAAHREPVSA